MIAKMTFQLMTIEGTAEAENPYRRGRLSTVDLLVLTAPFDIENIIYFFTK